MSRTTTTRIGLSKPTPGTGEPVNASIDVGTNWDKVDDAVGAQICTSGTRPGSPYDGQMIRETDTRRMYIWNATQSAWDQIVLPYPAGSILTGSGGSTAGLRMTSSGAALNNRYLALRGSGDTVDHFAMDYDGLHQWGPGSGALDTNLYRSAADTLKTDDNLIVAGNLTVTGAFTGRQQRINQSVRTTSTGTFTTTETSIDSVSASLVSGRIYKVYWFGRIQSSVADGYVRLRIREDSVAGTQLQLGQIGTNVAASQSFTLMLEAEFTAVSTASKTFHVTAVRQSGTGNISSVGASDTPNYLYVDYIRG